MYLFIQLFVCQDHLIKKPENDDFSAQSISSPEKKNIQISLVHTMIQTYLKLYPAVLFCLCKFYDESKFSEWKLDSSFVYAGATVRVFLFDEHGSVYVDETSELQFSFKVQLCGDCQSEYMWTHNTHTELAHSFMDTVHCRIKTVRMTRPLWR